MTVIAAEWVRLPLVPWTVTVYVPAATLPPTLMVNVEEPDPPLTLEELRETVGPDGDTDELRVTVPVKPSVEETIIVVVPLSPWFIDNEACPAVMSKSGAPPTL